MEIDGRGGHLRAEELFGIREKTAVFQIAGQRKGEKKKEQRADGAGQKKEEAFLLEKVHDKPAFR